MTLDVPVTVSVIVPTFNEAPNVAELVARVGSAVADRGADLSRVEIIFVDDSTDDTPRVIEQVARTAVLPVRMIHRTAPEGGLGGAVVEGMRTATGTWCVVMDGDLQHPPELIPVLVARGESSGADVVVASRYCGEGSADGLAGGVRRLVSSGSTLLTKSMFPRRLRDCTDPMTGFFAIRRESVDLADLRPRGFKILLELLARQQLRVVEEPFVFAERHAGESKASMAEGLRFLVQLAGLRFGRMSRFAFVGALGAVLNLLLMAALLAFDVHYLPAAVIATEVTIITNFAMTEGWVFRDLRHEGRSLPVRFLQFFAFNNAEALLRLPVLVVLVEVAGMNSVLAQALALAVAFLMRFVFVSQVIYRPRRTGRHAVGAAPIEQTVASA
ncbi:MAG TPA: glycosyltransferase [Nakamurella multipartita]|jgi:dolichol-phosphate mannosyltransferase|nr:glycosyltransferase [Nakamurella multipartita]